MLRMLRRVRNGYKRAAKVDEEAAAPVSGGGSDGVDGRRGASFRSTGGGGGGGGGGMSRGRGVGGGGRGRGREQWCRGAVAGAVSALALCSAGMSVLSMQGRLHLGGPPALQEEQVPAHQEEQVLDIQTPPEPCPVRCCCFRCLAPTLPCRWGAGGLQGLTVSLSIGGRGRGTGEGRSVETRPSPSSRMRD